MASRVFNGRAFVASLTSAILVFFLGLGWTLRAEHVRAMHARADLCAAANQSRIVVRGILNLAERRDARIPATQAVRRTQADFYRSSFRKLAPLACRRIAKG